MSSREWRSGWDRFGEDRYETNPETLSQAIRAAASEEPCADGSVLFGQIRGTVVGLRYYTGVVSIRQHHLVHSGTDSHSGPSPLE